MPNPERLLNTLQRAAQAFQLTPGRQGRVVSLVNAVEVAGAGDLHGNLANFRTLLRRANLAAHPHRHLVVQELIHGPFRYPDGGDKSHQILDLTAALKCEFPERVHFLLGNHELSQWTGRAIVKNDLDLNELFVEGVRTAYGEWADRICQAYQNLFAVAPLLLRTPNRVVLCHSVPSARRLDAFELAALEREELRPEDLLPGGAAHALVWGRDADSSTVTTFLGKVDGDWVISGHIPCPETGYAAPNERQLILDAQGTPGCFCLFSTAKPVTLEDLLRGVATL